MADKFAIVTGASTGIGFELAKLAAEDGYDLLVAADEPLIDGCRRRFAGTGRRGRRRSRPISRPSEGVDRLLDAAGGRPVDVLVRQCRPRPRPRLPRPGSRRMAPCHRHQHHRHLYC